MKLKHLVSLGILFTASLALMILIGTTHALSQEMLGDPGFELSVPNGSFPSSGYWNPGWYPSTAGAFCTTTSAYSGGADLWTYTADTSLFSWAGTYQNFVASSGQVAIASAYIQTLPPGQWVGWGAGSKAVVRVEFLNSASQVLAFYDSSGVTTANSGWGLYSVTTSPSPSETAKVRYRAYVEKPAGVAGLSVANFDNLLIEAHIREHTQASYLTGGRRYTKRPDLRDV